jgi:ribonuclease HI
VHGYMYESVPDSKPAGPQAHLLTALGYIERHVQRNEAVETLTRKTKNALGVQSNCTLTAEPVVPLHYVDNVSSGGANCTNNAAEVMAIRAAMEHAALHEDIQDVLILTDSQYAKQGAAEWLPGWLSRNFRKSDDTIISNAGEWRYLAEAMEILTRKGVTLHFGWIKGHADILGNIIADKMATMGVFSTQSGKPHNQKVVEADVSQYWKHKVERHPFFNHRKLFFNTIKQDNPTPGLYFLGEVDKEVDLVGKKSPTDGFSVVRLENNDAIVDSVINYQSERNYYRDSLFMLFMDEVFTTETHKDLSIYGALAIEPPSGYRMDLQSIGSKPLTREFKPPRIAMRAVEELTALYSVLENYEKNSSALLVTDITSQLYETAYKEVKPAKKNLKLPGSGVAEEAALPETIQTLRAEIGVGQASLKTSVKYVKPDQSIGEAEITLNMGTDLLDRNSLKRLESLKPTIHVVVWAEGSGTFRYATVVHAAGATGIWAGVYSNLYVIPYEQGLIKK